MVLKGIRKEVANVNPYIAGKTIDEVKEAYGLEEIIKLGSNENAYGPFKHAKQAMIDEINQIFMYPDKTYEMLKIMLAEKFGVSPKQLALSHGAGGMLETLARTFIEKGDEVIIPDQTYGLYREITKLMGGEIVSVGVDHNYRIDIVQMIEKITPKTKLIWLCNPNNPTGTVIAKEDFSRLLGHLNPYTWVVLDEAYAEFAAPNALPDALAQIEGGQNIIIVRTFSKAYALAGARVGYAMASPEMIKIIETVAEPFNANRIGLAGAIAALKDDQLEYQTSLAAILDDRAMLTEALGAMGIECVESHANFVFCRTPYDADQLAEQLLLKGIIIRPCAGWGYPDAFRVTVGTHYENVQFLKKLKAVMKAL
jgi:histidinol-phosphate aminotransferase